jgi:hypothetical protein
VLSTQFQRLCITIHPPYQGVCGWHGTEEQRVTLGELVRFPGGSWISNPISESEVGSDVARMETRRDDVPAIACSGRIGNGTRQIAANSRCWWRDSGKSLNRVLTHGMVRPTGPTSSRLTLISRIARCGSACRVVWQGRSLKWLPPMPIPQSDTRLRLYQHTPF